MCQSSQIKPFKCRCGHLLCYRRGNEIVHDSFVIELKRSHNVECPHCGTYTLFGVNKQKTLALEGEIKDNSQQF
jgi:hypothetical protein